MEAELEVTLSRASIYSPHRDGAIPDRLQAMSLLLRKRGCGYFRATRAPGGIWMEGWERQPHDQGTFSAVHAERVRLKDVSVAAEEEEG